MSQIRSSVKKITDLVKHVTKQGDFHKGYMGNLKVITAGGGSCSCEMKVDENQCNMFGKLHGGVSATLVDVVSTFALMTNEKAENGGVSVNLNIMYMKGADVGDNLVINASTSKLGKTMAFLTVDIANKDTGALLIQGSHSKFIGLPIADASAFKAKL